MAVGERVVVVVGTDENLVIVVNEGIVRVAVVGRMEVVVKERSSSLVGVAVDL